MESLQIIDKFCSCPLANFLIIVYIFMPVIRNAKQSFADISKQSFLNVSQISRENTYVRVSFNKVAGQKTWYFIKRRLQHRCFPVKFLKVLRTPFLQNNSGGCFWKQKDILSSFYFLLLYIFHDRGPYHIETIPLIYSANQWTG